MKKRNLFFLVFLPLCLVAAGLFLRRSMPAEQELVSPAAVSVPLGSDVHPPEGTFPRAVAPLPSSPVPAGSGRRAQNLAKYFSKRKKISSASPADAELTVTEEDLLRLQEEDLSRLRAVLRERGKKMADELLAADLAALEPEQKEYFRRNFYKLWDAMTDRVASARRRLVSEAEYEKETRQISDGLTEELNRLIASIPPSQEQARQREELLRQQEETLAEVGRAYGPSAEKELRVLLDKAQQGKISEKKFMALQARLLEKYQARQMRRWREELHQKLEREKREVRRRYFSGVPKNLRPEVKRETDRIYSVLETEYAALYNAALPAAQRDYQRAEAERRAVLALNRLLAKVTAPAASSAKKSSSANPKTK